MKAIFSIILILIFLTGCGITGQVVSEIEEQQTLEQKDQESMEDALSKGEVSLCYGIQTQDIRETCFIELAKKLKDSSICNNLLGKTIKQSCIKDAS